MFLGRKSALLAERVQYSMELTCEGALPTLIPMLDDSRIKGGGLSVNWLQIWFTYSHFPTSADAANLSSPLPCRIEMLQAQIRSLVRDLCFCMKQSNSLTGWDRAISGALNQEDQWQEA